MSTSRSEYVCDRCGLPLQRTSRGWRHAVNAQTKARSCGPSPVPRRRDRLRVAPGMPVTLWKPAGVITVGGRPRLQRWRAGAFEGQYGKVTRLTLGGVPQALIVLNHAEVASDGAGVTLHYEVLEVLEEDAA